MCIADWSTNILTLVVVILSLHFPVQKVTGEERFEACSLRLELVDADTGNTVPGLIQLRDSDGKRLHVSELLDRGLGLPDEAAIHDWYVLSQARVLAVPRGRLTVRGFSGLETEIAEVELDLTGRDAARKRLELRRFCPARIEGWQAANTHVHLKKTTRPETDRYLIECSMADGLDIVFVSYLERPSEHAHYSTNNYTRDELRAMSNTHTHFDHGEEHRHNFTPFDEGYGHVMLLNIPELIKPVSIGPGITERGTDGTPLRVGIDKARSFGGRIIWCHNAWGLENVPSWLASRLDANNIFDGGTHGSYQHSFYRYLNIGVQVPFSTGTDWFMYDFSRVYVKSETRLTPEDWLTRLAHGRTYISNGPLLEFSVAGNTVGDHVSLAEPGKVSVVGRAVGRCDFKRLELVRNGRVIEQVEARAIEGHFRADLEIDVDIDRPAWLALRTPPPSAPKKGLVEKTTLNEYGCEIFSHTCAIFIDIGGKRIFVDRTAKELMGELQENRDLIGRRGKFSDEHERRHVLDVHDEAIKTLKTLRDRS